MQLKAKDITGDHVEALTNEVVSLRDEVRTLRDVLAELVQDVQWAVRNNVVPTDIPPDRFRLTSMPADPCAVDFHDRVNTVSPIDDCENSIHLDADNQNNREQTLWSDD